MSGAELKSTLRRIGWTQKRFAHVLGWSEEHISRMIHDRKHIQPHIAVLVTLLARLADLGVDPNAAVSTAGRAALLSEQEEAGE